MEEKGENNNWEKEKMKRLKKFMLPNSFGSSSD